MLIPQRGRKIRWLLILCGLAVFLWSSPEDNGVLPPVLLGAVCSVALMLWWGMGWFGGKTLSMQTVLGIAALLGGMGGLATSLIAALLMLLKNLRHAHIFPDYPLPLIGAVLERAPFWGLAGALAGVGAVFLYVTLKSFWL
jgi:hypothetical protein